MRNSFFGFVAHVGEAEGFATEFAVAGIDDEVVFLAQASRKIDNVDAFVVFDTGQRFRSEAFFGKKVEASSFHPIVDERVGARVSVVTICQSFLEDFVEL